MPPTWPLDPGIDFLNHGSFGSCPREVQEAQDRTRARMERQPVQFFIRDLPALRDAARAALAAFVGAPPAELAFVPNATAGVNALVGSLDLRAGDEVLVTDHEYNATRNALEHAAARAGARVVVAPLPFPLASADEAVAAILGRATPRTRFAVLDHVTSPTGLVLPLERLVAELKKAGVEVVVDGAHGPGMLALDLGRLGAAGYTGNCHKWVCAPKGAAFVHVPASRLAALRPPVISHGANEPPGPRSRFHLEFDWMGTDDPSPALAVPDALRLLGSALPGGWPELMRRNRALALEGRRIVGEALGTPPAAPESMIGSLAAIPLPGTFGRSTAGAFGLDPLQERLLAEHRIEVPVIAWPDGRRFVRISAQLYNSAEQYVRLAAALKKIL